MTRCGSPITNILLKRLELGRSDSLSPLVFWQAQLQHSLFNDWPDNQLIIDGSRQTQNESFLSSERKQLHETFYQ